MGFNYGFERKKFEKEWARLKKIYAEAGMTEDAIQKLYEFDLKVFNRKRADAKREQPIAGILKEKNEDEGLSDSTVLHKLNESLIVTDTYSTQPERYRWIDEIENAELYEIIVNLPDRDKEFLTFLVEGYTREDIAKIRKVTIQSVNKKITKFKDLLAEVVRTSTNA